MFRRLGVAGTVERVFLARAPVAPGVRSDFVHLLEGWPDVVDQTEVQVFPPLAREVLTTRTPSSLLAGLKSFSVGRKAYRKKGVDRVTVKAPAVRRRSCETRDVGEDSTASDAGSVSSGVSRDSLDLILGDPNPVAPPPPDDDGGRHHEKQAIPFGCWTYSLIKSKGVVVGVGGNCGCHFGAYTRTTCKKAFHFLAQDAELPSEDRVARCRCLAKARLLMGRDILTGSSNGRKRHVGIARAEIQQFADLHDEAQLDAMAR